MSRLYLSETGRVVPTLCEELTTFRRARKILRLPSTSAVGTPHVLARSYPDTRLPLRIAVNGTEVAAVEPVSTGRYQWYAVEARPGILRDGENTLELWTDATAMTAWSLAVEGGHADPKSSVSDDGGNTWRNDRMGYLNVLRGEFVVRVRLAEGEDPPPPPMVWEDAASPRLASLRQIVPAKAQGGGTPLERVKATSSWLASSWEHTNSRRAAQYAPWDAETILFWGRVQSGHNGKRPVAMCVHYAAAFVSACQAVGIPARCAALTDAFNGSNGHFVAEAWLDEFGKWVMVDPNADATFWKDGVPLSLPEIRGEGTGVGRLIEFGEGSAFQRQFPHMVEFVEHTLEKGVCFKHRSVWYRADLLSHPELSPPGHGALAYCETGLVWEKGDLEGGGRAVPLLRGCGLLRRAASCQGRVKGSGEGVNERGGHVKCPPLVRSGTARIGSLLCYKDPKL